jgi:hypothetical protein
MTTIHIKNILEIYKTCTPGLYKIIIDTITKRKGRWESKAYNAITHPDLLENNKYLSEECIKKIDTCYQLLKNNK